MARIAWLDVLNGLEAVCRVDHGPGRKQAGTRERRLTWLHFKLGVLALADPLDGDGLAVVVAAAVANVQVAGLGPALG